MTAVPEPSDWQVEEILRGQYTAGQEQVAAHLVGLRLHRLERCELFPICPGPAVGEAIEQMCDHDLIGLTLSALHAVADRDVELENMRAELSRLRADAGGAP